VTGKILTVVPLLVLSGFFFAAGIVEGGVLFAAFAAVVTLAFVRGAGGAEGAEDSRPTPEETTERRPPSPAG
jgi:hypothetical protein